MPDRRPETSWDNTPLDALPSATEALSILPVPYRPSARSTALPLTSAKSLVPHILARSPRQDTYKPHLFLVGDKTLPDLPAALLERDRDLVMVQVYETSVSPDLAGRLAGVRRSFCGGLDLVGRDEGKGSGAVGKEDGDGAWLAFFSPSSAAAVFDLLALPGYGRGSAEQACGNEMSGGEWGKLKIAVIGETTNRWIMDHLGRRADAVAKVPTPVGLAQAVWDAVEGRNSGGGAG
jgi:hypothetical protein